LARIRPGYGAPLPGLHLPGVHRELNSAGAGDTGDADEQVEGVLERLVGVGEDAGLLAQVFELGAESDDAVLQTRDQEVWCRRGELVGAH